VPGLSTDTGVSPLPSNTARQRCLNAALPFLLPYTASSNNVYSIESVHHLDCMAKQAYHTTWRLRSDTTFALFFFSLPHGITVFLLLLTAYIVMKRTEPNHLLLRKISDDPL
jgi:hypothetical protein